MDIQIQRQESDLLIALNGRLDANTSVELQEAVDKMSAYDSILFDFSDLEYISSAGLRVLLSIYKDRQLKNASLTILNCNDVVKDVFDMTGFSDVFHVR